MILIEDSNLIGNIKSTILGFWPNRKNNYFPAPLPVSLEKKDFFKILKYPYVICLKSNGIRYLMLCMNNSVYMIDRAFNIYIVDVKFKHQIYGNNSYALLLDGELIDNRYIIHDCICIFGKDVSSENLHERYENVVNVVNNFWIKEEQNTILLETKNFYGLHEIKQVANLLNDKNVDGLIFTPVSLPIGTHTQYTLFKWKIKSQHTFDFKLVEDNSSFNAYIIQSQNQVKFASVDKNTPKGKEFGDLLIKNCPNFKNNSIVECEYDDKLNTFIPIKVREDKLHPNNLYTIEKTLNNIKEDITIDEIIERLKNS